MSTLRAGLAAIVPTLLFTTGSAAAQVELPRPSPLARVMQTVGLTEIEVEYSSPAARKRAIWGALVPFGEVWRTGANANTIVRFSRDVEIVGKTVPAGRYSLYTIPGRDWWEVMINKKTDGGGSRSYDRNNDALRLRVRAVRAPFRERLTFLFSDTAAEQTNLDLEWAGVRVRIPIETNTNASVDAAIATNRSKLDQDPRAAAQVASYLLRERRDLSLALELVNASLKKKTSWYGLWVKAQLLGAKGETGAAIRLTREALAFDEDSGAFRFYAGQMKKGLARWGAL